MSKLLTIEDLYNPSNDWKPLLEHITWLGTALEQWTELDTGFGRTIPVYLGDDTKRSPGLHASELNTCIRQATYSLRGDERNPGKIDANMRMRFRLGTMMHASLQDDFEHLCAQTLGRVSFEDEVRISKEMGGVAAQYDYASSCDGVFTFCDDCGQPYLRLGLEIKTMSAGEYDKAKAPKPEHVQQATLYQKCLDLPLVWYLYYNKSNSNWTRPSAPWVVPFAKDSWSILEARSIQVHQHVAVGTLPDREEGMPCTWCPFSDSCGPAFTKLRSRYTGPPRRFGR